MVAILEPRKGQAFVIDAFVLLWKRGLNACLVIDGEQGWMVETLVERLRHHLRLNKRLFGLRSSATSNLRQLMSAAHA